MWNPCLTDGLGDDKVLIRVTSAHHLDGPTVLDPLTTLPKSNLQPRRPLPRPMPAAWQAGTCAVLCISVSLMLGEGFVGPQAALAQPAATEEPAAVPSGSGLPVPRYVSLKSDRVNMRNGPGTDYPTGWVYRRAGLPLEIIKEFEGWRQVRDADSATGWVLQSFLSGRRTALVQPWERKPDAPSPMVSVFDSDSTKSKIVANVEAGVIANLHACDGRWCRVTIEQFSGYIEQNKLWGVYPGETLK